ncbi:hypothetical protein [Winogradskyella psychrotolerans]|uniref:hypothetical protein n=1 Tax=Winogradskyella psychrotolerans TaxID=1344585 RepID=UPI001C07A84F|nr:hypothetical protein [Winogradskyella psychrotolerans]MBU2928089.1 hypothetical protein [Winogradskyella psychrotolerans]
MRLYFLLIILIPYLSISQANINIKVNYKPVISINLDTVQGPSNFKKSFRNSIDKSELLSFNLAINSKDSLSVYERNELLDTSINKLDLNLINLIIDGEGKYFFSNGKLIHDYNVLDKNLKVEIAKNIDWILINEKKKSVIMSV